MIAPACRRELAQTIVIKIGEVLGDGLCAAAEGVEKVASKLGADRMNGIVTAEAFVHQARQGLANWIDALGELRLDDDMNGGMQRVAGKCFVRAVVLELLRCVGVKFLHEFQPLGLGEREPLLRVGRP